MAEDKKPKLQRGPAVYLPKGVLGWASLIVPDTKYKAEGEYSAKVVVPGDNPTVQSLIANMHNAAELAKQTRIEELEAKLAEAKTGADKGKLKKDIEKVREAEPQVGYSQAFDSEGNATTDIEFSAKLVAERKDKKTGRVIKQKPDIVDAQGKPCNPPAIWRGSIVRLVVRTKPYATPAAVGVSLHLQGVQIIKLVAGGDAAPIAYEAEEGGYEAEEDAEDTRPGSGYESEEVEADEDEPTGGANF
jgi:hypothetical protein